MDDKNKETIIVSFSGGRTSGFMWDWLVKNMSHIYNFIAVFANTGLEHENTLEFVDQCDKHYGMNLFWLEAVVNPKKGEGTRHKIVDFETASRNGEPMEEVIKKYGLPNMTYIHCTRETKLQVIKSYQDSIGLKNARNAVGIRGDEFHRVKNNKGVIYPLATITNVSKYEVLKFWEDMPFDLDVIERDGNCRGCFKKSDVKLKETADNTPYDFDFWIRMEKMYGNVVTKEEVKKETGVRKIYRHYRTAYDVKYNLNLPDKLIEDDECAEECGSVISEYISKEADNVLFI